MSSKEKKKYSAVPSADASAEPDTPNTAADLEGKAEDNVMIKIKAPEEAGKDFELLLPINSSLIHLKDILAQKTGIETTRQRLIHFGKMIHSMSDDTLLFNGTSPLLKAGDFVHLVPLPKGAASNPNNNNSDARANGSATQNVIGNATNVTAAPLDGVEFRFFDFNAFEPAPGGAGNNSNRVTYSSEEYFERMELQLWRARVKLLSSLMLFYYFLQFMGDLSTWMHPEELNMRFEKNHHPSTMFYTVDIIESTMGIACALNAMKAASSDSVSTSLIYLRSTFEVTFVHFIGFTIYYTELLQGKIRVRPDIMFPPGPDEDNGNSESPVEKEMEHEVIVFSVFFSLLINIFVWLTILSSAVKFHKHIVATYAVTEEEGEGSQPNETTIPRNTTNTPASVDSVV